MPCALRTFAFASSLAGFCHDSASDVLSARVAAGMGWESLHEEAP